MCNLRYFRYHSDLGNYYKKIKIKLKKSKFSSWMYDRKRNKYNKNYINI